jgi:hypothetical protein
LRALDVDSASISAIWFRQIPAGGDPLYRVAEPGDFRWQRGSTVEAIYFADSEPTAWAEWYRMLAEVGLPPRQSLPRDLWPWRIELVRVADLAGDDRLARVGLPPLLPTRRQWAAFQAVGEQLHAAGWPALLSASAARPEGRTLCVFRDAGDVAGATPQPPAVHVPDPPLVPTGLRT